MKRIANRYVNGVRNDYLPGNVYIFKDIYGIYKIGLTGRDIYVRKRELEEDWGRLELIALVHSSSMRELELKMHNYFDKFRYKPYQIKKKSGCTEFFKLNYSQHWKARYLLYLWGESPKPGWFYFYFVGSWAVYGIKFVFSLSKKTIKKRKR